jgi:hypothetical protein
MHFLCNCLIISILIFGVFLRYFGALSSMPSKSAVRISDTRTHAFIYIIGTRTRTKARNIFDKKGINELKIPIFLAYMEKML